MKLNVIFVMLIAVVSNTASASFPLGGYIGGTAWVTVSKVTASDVARFEVQGGTLCGTNVFTIDTRLQGGKEQFSTVLAAAAAGKKIFVETWSGCPSVDPAQNWGMKVGAVTIQY